MPDVTIKVRDNGPFLVEGPVTIVDASGGFLPGVTISVRFEVRTQVGVTNEKGEAFEQKKAFWMSFQVRGIDSTLFRGLAGTAVGSLHQVRYDSDPSGGSGSPPRFFVQECPKPSVSMSRGGYAEIVCGTG